MAAASPTTDQIQTAWQSRWEEALAVWSRFTKLSPPRWCFSEAQEKKEELRDSFAMIRLQDHAVVISLRQIAEKRLENFPVEIMAHEIGHHVYAPADLRDNARLIARTRAGLPTREPLAALIANLYTDLLINDRLQRGAGLDMAGVYKALKVEPQDQLWKLYMRIYEVLWSLPPGTLAPAGLSPKIRSDAELGARVVRAFAKDWLRGAGRFAALCLPYLLEDYTVVALRFGSWLDTQQAGAGAEVPEGLSGIDDDEEGGAIHPAEDPDLTGLDEEGATAARAGGEEVKGGRKNRYREPTEYVELMKSLGVKVAEDELVMRYYRERAIPHLIRFPSREVMEAQDPLPEGLDTWEVSSPLTDADWTESLARSPHVIPGVTILQRTYGTSEGSQPERLPVDLYLGVDCSGSMLNPKYGLSYPVLAGVIVSLSALRARSRVMVCLSGEPGKYTSTDGFTGRQKDVMKVLTGYLGTGYSFGILRLKETFLEGPKPKRPVHILVVTDADIFHMLGEVKEGYDIAREAAAVAGGGATFVLNMAGPSVYQKNVERLKASGWRIHYVENWENLVAFAKAFSEARFGKTSALGKQSQAGEGGSAPRKRPKRPKGKP